MSPLKPNISRLKLEYSVADGNEAHSEEPSSTGASVQGSSRPQSILNTSSNVPTIITSDSSARAQAGRGVDTGKATTEHAHFSELPKPPSNGKSSSNQGSATAEGKVAGGPHLTGETQPSSETVALSGGSCSAFPDRHSSNSLQPNVSIASSNIQKSGLTPASSFIELKRFFGKGRTNFDHHNTPPTKKPERKRPTFSILGLGKKKDHSSKSNNTSSAPATPGASTPRASTPGTAPSSASNSCTYMQNPFASSLSTPGGGSTSSLYRPHISSHHSHCSHHSHHHHGSTPATPSTGDSPSGGYFGIKKKLSSHHRDFSPSPSNSRTGTDNFVVHAPDYEADWDPFHIFGHESSSERMPFLESGITKYGEIGRDMGSGAGGSVRMMERPSDNKVFAVKEFRVRKHNESVQRYVKHVTSEYALGAALHHKNIIETIDLIKEGDKYFEVMEYGPHDYFELVMSSTMTTHQVNSAFSQIINGVNYLHTMGVAHRDLKLDNCVVTSDGVVKIIDFGSAVVFKYPMSPSIHLAQGIMGSDPYLAPEVFSKQPYQPQVADMWSCGIIYACSYMRRFPWKLPQKEDRSFRKFCENPTNLYGDGNHQDNPRKISGPWRLLRLLPRDARPMIAAILKVDPQERITTEEIMTDKWFSHIHQISVLPPNTREPLPTT